MRRIVLQERGGPVLVSYDTNNRWLLDAAVEELHARGIVQAARAESFGYMLTPRQFVGELRLPYLTLVVREKGKGLVRAMSDLALSGTAREVAKIAFKDGQEAVLDPYHALLAALRRMLIAEGAPWVYSQQVLSGSPRGRMLGAATIRRFAARGIDHRVVSSKSERKDDPEFLAVMWTALHLARAERGVTDVSAHLSDVLRGLPAYEPLPLQPALKSAARLADRYRAEGPVKDCIAAAASILNRERNASALSFPVPSGFARFVNLEDLWERAATSIFQLSACAMGGDCAVRHPLRGKGLLLFNDSGPEIDPDIIVYSGSAVSWVIDAKYKYASTPEAGDLYQLLSYMRRLKCGRGMLVFPSEDGARIQRLGRLPSEDFEIYAAYLDAAALKADGLSCSFGVPAFAEKLGHLPSHGGSQ